jgi:CreA protein
VGPIEVDIAKLKNKEEVFTQRTSIFFKATRIYRLIDKKHNTLVYLAVSSKLIDGSPANSVSAVPIMPWPGK